jgi:hypothetical protein
MPSQSLLSILGVLRRPATAADALPAGLKQFFETSAEVSGRQVFIDDVGTSVVTGVTYYVIPIRYTGCGQLPLRATGDAVMLWGGSSGGGSGTAALIDARGMWGSESGGTGADPGRTTFLGVVPDGVATVTLHYPAGKLGGFSHRSGPALTVTGHVVDNVVVVTVERAGNQAGGAVTTTWRAANGTVVKTLHGAL